MVGCMGGLGGCARWVCGRVSVCMGGWVGALST